jgi:hypothetical protein
MTPDECFAVAFALACAGEHDIAETIMHSILVWGLQGSGGASAQAVRLSLAYAKIAGHAVPANRHPLPLEPGGLGVHLDDWRIGSPFGSLQSVRAAVMNAVPHAGVEVVSGDPGEMIVRLPGYGAEWQVAADAARDACPAGTIIRIELIGQ